MHDPADIIQRYLFVGFGFCLVACTDIKIMRVLADQCFFNTGIHAHRGGDHDQNHGGQNGDGCQSHGILFHAVEKAGDRNHVPRMVEKGFSAFQKFQQSDAAGDKEAVGTQNDQQSCQEKQVNGQ